MAVNKKQRTVAHVGSDSYHMFGIRSEIPVMPAIRLLWEMVTPFGMPVEPLVYMMTAMSEGSGGLRSRAAGTITEDSTNTRGVSASRSGKGAWVGCERRGMFKDSPQHVWTAEIFRCLQTKGKKSSSSRM